MNFSTLRPEIQVRLAVLAPLIGLFLSIFVVYPAWERHSQLLAEIAKQEKELSDLRATPLPPAVPDGVIVASEPSEPPRFLGQISQIALNANCRIVGFDLVPIVAPATSDAATGQEQKDAGVIKPLRARIELDATYPQVREFLYRLSCAPRPFTVTTLVLSAPNATPGKSAAAGTLHAAVDIERYVVPPTG